MKRLHFFQGVTEDGPIPVYYIALNDAATDILVKTHNQELELLSRPVSIMLEGLTTRIKNEDQYKRYDRHGNLREMSFVNFVDFLQTMKGKDFQKMVCRRGTPNVPTDFDVVVGNKTLHYKVCLSWLEVTCEI